MYKIEDMHQLRVIINCMKRNYFIIMPVILKKSSCCPRENSRDETQNRENESPHTHKNTPGKNKKCTQSVKHFEKG